MLCSQGKRMAFDRLKRREFITLLGGAAATWPLAARARQRTVPVVGYLSGGSAGPFAPFLAAFRQGLRETDYVEWWRSNTAGPRGTLTKDQANPC